MIAIGRKQPAPLLMVQEIQRLLTHAPLRVLAGEKHQECWTDMRGRKS